MSRERFTLPYTELLTSLAAVAILAIPASAQSDGGSYSSAALRAFVERASRANSTVPAALASYHARLETEVARLHDDASGRELPVGIEQMAGEVTWLRDGSFEQHVTGHRGDIGLLPWSAAKGHSPWIVPTLYGDRLFARIGDDTTPARSAGGHYVASMFRAVHPFASDRDSTYRFTGGDTVARMRTNGRLITLVRVHVEPRPDLTTAQVVFSGDVDCDAERGVIAHVRGYFHDIGPQPRGRRFIREIAFAEIITAEIDGRYWLPVYERYEFRVSVSLLEGQNSVVRIITRLSDHAINVPIHARTLASVDTTGNPLRSLAWATDDSLTKFSDWHQPAGVEASQTSREDFSDVAPDDQKPTGPPRFDRRVRAFDQLYHFNRAEGIYTGVGSALHLRDRAPGVTLRANAGWAWSEATLRGAVDAEKIGGPWVVRARAERSLASMSDFLGTSEAFGPAIGAFSGYDLDYLDRHAASLGVERNFKLGDVRLGLLTGPGRDSPESSRIGAKRTQNRDTLPMLRAAAGSYWRHNVSVAVHSTVLESPAMSGVGIEASYLRGDGLGSAPLSWSRVEGRIVAREHLGRTHALTLAVRADAGTSNSRAPIQQLFELGGPGTLEGYDYHAFSGNRAVLARAAATYVLPFRLPLPVSQRFAALLTIAPTVETSLGAVSASPATAATLDAAYGTHLWSVTGHPRSTVTAGVRLLGGGLLIGAARSLDHPERWRFIVLPGLVW